ncbi:MAG: hypothetical protein JOZ47_22525 [Kutzneria sp.]|nr:hypothetical protein [Kutzneria sp.]
MASIDMGNGYQIDFDDANKFVKALQDQKGRLNDSLQKVNRTANVEPPGDDDYSGSYVGYGVNPMVKQHDDWNTKKQQELQDLIDKITAAVDNYKKTEHNNTMRA